MNQPNQIHFPFLQKEFIYSELLQGTSSIFTVTLQCGAIGKEGAIRHIARLETRLETRLTVWNEAVPRSKQSNVAFISVLDTSSDFVTMLN